MTPILYASSETDFTTHGLGGLPDAISCTVTEERNSVYELEMKYPVDGLHYDDIALSCIILAQPAYGKDPEPFRIYKITRPLNGMVTICAEHISYQLNSIPVMPFSAENLTIALLGLKGNSATDNPFTFWTDKSVSSAFSVSTPASCRSLLGGVRGSILDTYGGEFEFTGYTVKLHLHRGTDNGVTIRYGKNLTDINQEENIENTITGIVPYWANDTDIVTLPEKFIDSEYASAYPYKRTVVHDFSADFDEKPTEEQLRTATQNYITKNEIGTPDVSIDVSFLMLSQFAEYADYELLEQVNLCDTVTVVFEYLGINKSAKVVATEFDVLTEKYNKITLGTVKANLSKVISEQAEETDEKIVDVKTTIQADIDSSIEAAAEKITGADGGYLIDKYTSDGHRYELLCMDTDSEDTATEVWRFNKNGIGHATRNASGELEYNIVATIDGEIDASYIKTGTLTASLIKAGILTDSGGNYYLNMETGSVTMKNAKITGGEIDIDASDSLTSKIRIGYTSSTGNLQEVNVNSAYTEAHNKSGTNEWNTQYGTSATFKMNGVMKSSLDTNGLYTYSGTTGTYAVQNSDGVSVYENSSKVGEFGSDVKISGGVYPDGTSDNPLGTVVSGKPSATVAVANETWTSCGITLTLTQGTWIIIPVVRFASNATGIRALEVTSDASPSSHASDISANATSGSVTKLHTLKVVTVSSGTKFLFLWAYQNSGGSLNVSTSDTSLTAIRVG